jgi:hypothetical protein
MAGTFQQWRTRLIGARRCLALFGTLVLGAAVVLTGAQPEFPPVSRSLLIMV